MSKAKVFVSLIAVGVLLAGCSTQANVNQNSVPSKVTQVDTKTQANPAPLNQPPVPVVVETHQFNDAAKGAIAKLIVTADGNSPTEPASRTIKENSSLGELTLDSCLELVQTK